MRDTIEARGSSFARPIATITSSYFETAAVGPRAFPSLAFGYSRDHGSDRPQIMIGLLVTSDGIPVAHHVFPGNAADVSTLPG
jgi:transposase